MTDEEILKQARKILKRRVRRNATLSNPNAVRDYLMMELADRERESFFVVFLNSQHAILEMEEMFVGTIDGAAVYPREVAKSALRHNAAAVLLANNHPSGVCEPSAADRRITERLTSALSLMDIRVLDHFIVAGAESYSFAESGLI